MVLDYSTALVALATVAVLVLLLRWAYSSERGRTSLVERRPKAGRSDEYGLLVAIASPGTYIEGELARARLEAAGIKVTLASTTEGPRVMVFHDDEAAARRVLSGG